MQSTNTNRGDVEIESVAVPYVDLRGEPAQAVEDTLKQILAEDNSGSDTLRLGGLRALVIIEPQSSDSLALTLARQGVQVIVGPNGVPLDRLLDRFREQLRMISAASSFGGVPTASAGTGGSSSDNRGRSESPYAQHPPWFDQAAFDERMHELQQPWRDEDAWKSET
jgi:hypothetical protein